MKKILGNVLTQMCILLETFNSSCNYFKDSKGHIKKVMNERKLKICIRIYNSLNYTTETLTFQISGEQQDCLRRKVREIDNLI